MSDTSTTNPDCSDLPRSVLLTALRGGLFFWCPMKRVNQDKLILTLLVNDITAAINAVMRIRKMRLKLDFTKHHAELHILDSRGNSGRYMMANPRTKQRFVCALDEQFESFTEDLELRLQKLNAKMILVCDRDKNKRTLAKVQVHVVGTYAMALTISEVVRGSTITETEFQTPDGDTP